MPVSTLKKDRPMSITIEQLSKSVQEARRQEKLNLDNAAACAGAAQAYEQLLTQLVQTERANKAAAALLAPAKKSKKK